MADTFKPLKYEPLKDAAVTALSLKREGVQLNMAKANNVLAVELTDGDGKKRTMRFRPVGKVLAEKDSAALAPKAGVQSITAIDCEVRMVRKDGRELDVVGYLLIPAL